MEKIIYFTHYFHWYASRCLRTGSLGSARLPVDWTGSVLGARYKHCPPDAGTRMRVLPRHRNGVVLPVQVVKPPGPPTAALGKYPGQLAASPTLHSSLTAAVAVVYGAGHPHGWGGASPKRHLGGPRHSTGPGGLGVQGKVGGCDFRQRWHRGTARGGLAITVPLTVVPWALYKSQIALPPSGGPAQLVGMARSCPCL